MQYRFWRRWRHTCYCGTGCSRRRTGIGPHCRSGAELGRTQSVEDISRPIFCLSMSSNNAINSFWDLVTEKERKQISKQNNRSLMSKNSKISLHSIEDENRYEFIAFLEAESQQKRLTTESRLKTDLFLSLWIWTKSFLIPDSLRRRSPSVSTTARRQSPTSCDGQHWLGVGRPVGRPSTLSRRSMEIQIASLLGYCSPIWRSTYADWLKASDSVLEDNRRRKR